MATANEEKFRTVVGAVLGIARERITDELSPNDIDTWDSLNHINLMVGLEQEFGVTLPTDNLAASTSIARLKALLADRGVML